MVKIVEIEKYLQNQKEGEFMLKTFLIYNHEYKSIVRDNEIKFKNAI